MTRTGGGRVRPGRGGAHIPVKLCFQAVWVPLPVVTWATKRAMSMLPTSVLKGHYGQGFLPGNLRTLATAYQANFNRHSALGSGLAGPRLDPDLTRHIELPGH